MKKRRIGKNIQKLIMKTVYCEKRLSDKTLRAYEIDLKQYIDFIDASTEVTKTIKDYIHFLYKKRNFNIFLLYRQY